MQGHAPNVNVLLWGQRGFREHETLFKNRRLGSSVFDNRTLLNDMKSLSPDGRQ